MRIFDSICHAFFAAGMLLMTACSTGGIAAASAEAPAADRSVDSSAAQIPKLYALSIVGYNYTDRYIDSFEVDGRGGGNMDISSADTGGSKSTCCYPISNKTKLPIRVRVAWVGAYCRSTRTNSDGETRTYLEPIWRVAEADLAGPIPPNPNQMEVHIYRDDHVEVAITDRQSQPREFLDKSPTGYIRPGVTIGDPECLSDYDRVWALDRAMEAFKKSRGAQ